MTNDIKPNTNRTAAVNRRLPWIPVGPDTPRGVRLLVINRAAGVATFAQYEPGSEWTHWQGLPYFED